MKPGDIMCPECGVFILINLNTHLFCNYCHNSFELPPTFEEQVQQGRDRFLSKI